MESDLANYGLGLKVTFLGLLYHNRVPFAWFVRLTLPFLFFRGERCLSNQYAFVAILASLAIFGYWLFPPGMSNSEITWALFEGVTELMQGNVAGYCDIYNGERYLRRLPLLPDREWYHPDRLQGLPHNIRGVCPRNNISLI